LVWRRSETLPVSGVSSSARIFSRVDLPLPFGPTSPARSPSKMPNDSALKSGAAPYALPIDWQLRRSDSQRTAKQNPARAATRLTLLQQRDGAS